MEILNIRLGQLMAIFIYSQDWNAVEGLITRLHNDDLMSMKLLLESTLKPEKATVKELASATLLLDARNVGDNFKWSINHALNSGTYFMM